jgi:hypothetical protein
VLSVEAAMARPASKIVSTLVRCQIEHYRWSQARNPTLTRCECLSLVPVEQRRDQHEHHTWHFVVASGALGVLAHLSGNRAAVYGLRIPLTPQEALHQAGQHLVAQLGDHLTDPTPSRARTPTL